MRDTKDIKDRIINFLNMRGPSLPVHISKDIKMDMIFTSAFLSELLSEKRIEMTKMSIGSSRIYYLEGQEEQLEKIAFENLKGKELEAFQKLKENKFLKNSKEEPAIKVALSSIPDFAKKIQKDDETIYKYFLEKSSYNEETLKENKVKEEPIKENSQEETLQKATEEPVEKENKEEIKKEQTPKPKKKVTKKKSASSQKKNEKFFNTVKEYLNSRNIEIIDIETFSKNDLILRVNQEGKEILLVCFNKKRITETDIINAHKKSQEAGIKYDILSLGEPTKKMTSFIEAIQNMNSIEKIE